MIVGIVDVFVMPGLSVLYLISMIFRYSDLIETVN